MAEFVHETGGEGLSVMFLEKKVNLKLGLQDISATQILREINFGHFGAPKSVILTIWAALKFEFLGSFAIFKCEIVPKIKIQSLQNWLKWQFFTF